MVFACDISSPVLTLSSIKLTNMLFKSSLISKHRKCLVLIFILRLKCFCMIIFSQNKGAGSAQCSMVIHCTSHLSYNLDSTPKTYSVVLLVK